MFYVQRDFRPSSLLVNQLWPPPSRGPRTGSAEITIAKRTRANGPDTVAAVGKANSLIIAMDAREIYQGGA